jgi:parallel beta-helix repeat protein
MNKPLTLYGKDEGNGMPILLNEGESNESAITLNSNGCIIKGMNIKNSKNYAIYILSNRNRIDGNTIKGGDAAIYLKVSMSNIITHNNIIVDKNFGHGIVAFQSFNNTIQSNNINFSGLLSDGINLVRSSSNFITDNNIMGNGLIGSSGISTRGSNYNILKNNLIETSGLYGSSIYLGSSDENSLEDNKVEHRDFSGSGITIYFSSGNKILNNTACSRGSINCAGIFLRWSNSNNISANRAYSTGWCGSGVTLLLSKENTLMGNEANNSTHGIYLGESEKNNVEYNIAQHNSDNDIYIDFFCVGTSIKHNTASIYIVEPRWSHIDHNSGIMKEFIVEFPDEVPIFTFADITDLIYNISQFIRVRFSET